MLKEDELAKLRKAGEVSGAARELGMSLCKPGAKLYDVAQEVEGYIREHGCGLAFPCNISKNEIAAHYTPSCNDESRFEVGDVVKIDCGGFLDGFIGDTAGTVEVGSNSRREIIESSKRARNTVAEFIGDGVPINEIGRAVEMSVKRDGFKVVENLCGHQITQWDLHAGLSVPSYDDGNTDTIKAGMTVAIEPFVTDGGGYVINGKPGNIVVIARDKEVEDPKTKEFLDYAKGEFHALPFCARSCDFPKAELYVKKLLRLGVLSSFSQLIEVNKGTVTQHEYTFYIDGARGEITTAP
ncbi:MAG: type II methionyl aminopeptidase [Candidatus Methanomethylophilus sp.]|jgi:methionyl aminopeptidase|nr:type II methionyl aminopeptidase [Methanomethylophilus sp.]MDD3232558.1 type II methionyl aminopeptidase [Methanomethylophilus sp.]MDD4221653.1 type II methionyl aminopeptidase [Methanomethylophilus sp.]MDD4668293.1 type II methionyl aminopeptidase [Methanomethylophilus sp.]